MQQNGGNGNAKEPQKIGRKVLRNIKDHVRTLVGFIGAICSILGFAAGSIFKLDAWMLFIPYVIFAFSLSMIVYQTEKKRASEQKKRYEEEMQRQLLQSRYESLETSCNSLRQSNRLLRNSMYQFCQILHRMRDVYCILQDSTLASFTKETNKRFLMALRDSLDEIVVFFNVTHKINGSVCIKLITDQDTEEVTTMLRDFRSATTRSENDDVLTFIRDQSAFKAIVYDNREHFFSNDLMSDFLTKRYYNKSRDYWADYYKSGAVVPIKENIEIEKSSGVIQYIPRYLGFLCLDATQKNRLSEQFTLNCLKGMSDVLCIILDRYRMLTNAK